MLEQSPENIIAQINGNPHKQTDRPNQAECSNRHHRMPIPTQRCSLKGMEGKLLLPVSNAPVLISVNVPSPRTTLPLYPPTPPSIHSNSLRLVFPEVLSSFWFINSMLHIYSMIDLCEWMAKYVFIAMVNKGDEFAGENEQASVGWIVPF